MSETIERLRAVDFAEAMEVMDTSFGFDPPTGFPMIHPAIYRPTDEWMRCNYAIRRGGRIAAVVGVYSRVTAVGETEWRVAGVGGVCVHPDHRRSGLMKLLMDRAVEDMQGDAHISFLGGQRQRYAYWGYEKCGMNPVFNVRESNLRHAFDAPPSTIKFEPLGEHYSDRVEACKAFYDQRPIHGVRPLEDFVKHLLTWRHEPWVALDEDGIPVGYLTVADKGSGIAELVGVSDDVRVDMVRAWVGRKEGRALGVRLQPDDISLIRLLGTFCESGRIEPACNWRILDWPVVVDALMKVKHELTPLAEGHVVIDVTEARLALTVSGGEASCTETDEEADLTVPALDAHRLLFGPQAPSLVMDLPSGAQSLDGWCPLPLGYAHPDGV
jgi:predicted acetyltransferase